MSTTDKVTPCCHSAITKVPGSWICSACAGVVDPVDCIPLMENPWGWAAMEMTRINSEAHDLVEELRAEAAKK